MVDNIHIDTTLLFQLKPHRLCCGFGYHADSKWSSCGHHGSGCDVCLSHTGKRTEDNKARTSNHIAKLIGRARKDARLYLKAKEGRRFYDSNSFTPDEIRTDESIPWSLVEIFYGGKKREVRYKVIENVYWKNATKRRPLRLIVIAPTGYRLSKNGRRYYRDPAYILTTDQETDPVILIQKYFDRWQIEVNFREEKDLLGLGEQQVWSEKAIPKAPAFLVATYAALLLASVICFQDKRDDKTFIPLPKWRNRPSKRPSCLDLLILMRREMTRSAHLAQQYGLKIEADDLISNSAA